MDMFYGIFDGHSSTAVSDYLSRTLSLMIFSHPLYSTNIQQAINYVFQENNQ